MIETVTARRPFTQWFAGAGKLSSGSDYNIYTSGSTSIAAERRVDLEAMPRQAAESIVIWRNEPVSSNVFERWSVELVRRFLETQGSDVAKEMAADLTQALVEALSGNPLTARKALDAWLMTAEICLEPDTLRSIEAASKEFAEGGGIPWSPPTR
jgi:hypothetical protein